VGYWGFVLVVGFLCLGYCGGLCGGNGMRLLWLFGRCDIFLVGTSIFLLGPR
jgi:hypothetical protein